MALLAVLVIIIKYLHEMPFVITLRKSLHLTVHALPIYIRRSDGQFSEQCFDTDNVIVLQPRYSVAGLFDGFAEKYEGAQVCVTRNTFSAHIEERIASHQSVAQNTGYLRCMFRVQRANANTVCRKTGVEGRAMV